MMSVVCEIVHIRPHIFIYKGQQLEQSGCWSPHPLPTCQLAAVKVGTFVHR
jgi:hypothetical protein